MRNKPKIGYFYYRKSEDIRRTRAICVPDSLVGSILYRKGLDLFSESLIYSHPEIFTEIGPATELELLIYGIDSSCIHTE